VIIYGAFIPVYSETITINYTSQGRSITNQDGISQEEFFNGETDGLFIPTGSNTFLFSASTFDANAQCEIFLTKRFYS